MATERHEIDARQARIDTMVAEFRAAQQRRLVRYGIALWERTEAAQRRLQLTGPEEAPSAESEGPSVDLTGSGPELP